MSTVRLLVNPARTRRSGVDDDILGQLSIRGVSAPPLRPADTDEIGATIKAAHEQGMTRLLIAGGDGLIHHALPAVAGSAIEIGVIGVGTGNDFARGLGLPSRLSDAVDVALGPTRTVDLITTTDGRLAASVVTGGFSGTVNARANTMRFPSGQQRYTVATLRELPSLEAVDLTLTVDGERHELSSAMFAVANTRYFGGGMAICPDADPTDGRLDVTVVGPTTALTLGRMLPTVFSGRHVRHPDVTVYRGSTIELSTDAPLWADGESFGPGDDVAFMTAGGALRVASNLA
ncbi:MAG: diacylglycerol kinase family protein [Actinomycetota bacterium]